MASPTTSRLCPGLSKGVAVSMPTYWPTLSSPPRLEREPMLSPSSRAIRAPAKPTVEKKAARMDLGDVASRLTESIGMFENVGCEDKVFA